MTDVVDRINEWVESDIHPDDWDGTLRDARDEIVSLRAMLKRQSEAAHQAATMMGKCAQKYGWLLGCLEAVANGLTTADKMLAATKERFGDE